MFNNIVTPTAWPLHANLPPDDSHRRRLRKFTRRFALQGAGNGVGVQQLHNAVGRAVLESHLSAGPTAEALLQVSHSHPPLAEGPGHLHDGGVQRQGQGHGHDEHGVENDQEGADRDLMPERPLLVVHQEHVVPGEGAIVEGRDEGQEEDHGEAGDAPQDHVWSLGHAESAFTFRGLPRLALGVKTLPGLRQIPEFFLCHGEVDVHQLALLLSSRDCSSQGHVAAVRREVPASSWNVKKHLEWK